MDLYIQFPFHFQRTCLDDLEIFEICWNVNGNTPANVFSHELDFYLVFIIVLMAIPDKELLIELVLKS